VNSQCVFRINKLADLINVIIPHFTKYPLLGLKVLTFELWKKSVILFEQKQHLTIPGRLQVLSIYLAIVESISHTFAEHFPDLVAVSLPEYKLDINNLNG
jgi:LAGLIDADG endonuclease